MSNFYEYQTKSVQLLKDAEALLTTRNAVSRAKAKDFISMSKVYAKLAENEAINDGGVVQIYKK